MALPGALIPWIEMRWLDTTGAPLVGGLVYTYTAGTSTPKATYTDSELTVAHTNPIVLDAYGRPASPIFLAAGGYKFIVYDQAADLQYTVDDVEDIALTWLSDIGETFATGATNVSSGYTVLATDYLITVASTGGANPCVVNLPTVVGRGQAVAVKNVGTVPLSITPNGVETIDTVASVFTVPPASSGLKPTVWLAPDGVSNWMILASHALAVPRQVALTAAPTTGTWVRGDLVWNSEPSAAGVPGWICVTAGSPGTWKALAAIAA